MNQRRPGVFPLVYGTSANGKKYVRGFDCPIRMND
jgi:hypothetical protein